MACALPDGDKPVQQEVGAGGVQLGSHHHPLAKPSRDQGAAGQIVGGLQAPLPRGEGGDPVSPEYLPETGKSWLEQESETSVGLTRCQFGQLAKPSHKGSRGRWAPELPRAPGDSHKLARGGLGGSQPGPQLRQLVAQPTKVLARQCLSPMLRVVV